MSNSNPVSALLPGDADKTEPKRRSMIFQFEEKIRTGEILNIAPERLDLPYALWCQIGGFVREMERIAELAFEKHATTPNPAFATLEANNPEKVTMGAIWRAFFKANPTMVAHYRNRALAIIEENELSNNS